MEQEATLETRMSHLDTFRPTCWLPPEIMPMQQVRIGEWADGFHNLVYALAGQLHDDCIMCRPDDWGRARLLYMLAEEVRCHSHAENASLSCFSVPQRILLSSCLHVALVCMTTRADSGAFQRRLKRCGQKRG
jgi:hypothetical protein